jgi:hypothetical protein
LKRSLLEALLTAAVSLLSLSAAEGRHPYGFYMVLRLVVTVGAGYWVIRLYKSELHGWAWPFAAVGLLLNPFLPIRMHREDWQPIDLWLGLLLLTWSLYWMLRKGGSANG